MLHPIQQKIDAINRRARRLSILYGADVSILLIISAAFVIGLTDYLLRFQDPGVRFLATLSFVIVFAWSLWRFAYPAWRYRRSQLLVAQRIEQLFPELEDRLSSTVEFLQQSDHDATAGSPALRRAVVAQMASQLEQLDFSRCIDARRTRRVTCCALLVCTAVAVVCALDVRASGLAARRLVMPWSNQQWPRRHELEFVNPPTRIAVGSDFEVELQDRNRHLPDEVQISYWFEGEPRGSIQTKEMRLLGDRMVHRLENVTRSLRDRAAGGDDDSMEWIELQVVEPSRVEEIRIRLHPPAYTGWPPEDSGENIRALTGTQVEVQSSLSKPAASVRLRTGPEGDPVEVPVRLSEDGLRFDISAQSVPSWVIEQSTVYWFEVADAQGITSGGDRRWNIHRALSDAAPQVTLERPGANTFVTAEAVVTIAGQVKDDLLIQAVDIQYQRSDRDDKSPPQIQLYRGPESAPQLPDSGLNTMDTHGDTQSVMYQWDLSAFADLHPGVWIEFSVVASDYKPQTGEVAGRRLTIISAEELEERIAARQSHLLAQLAEVLRVQRNVRSQTKGVQIRLDETGQLERSDVDRLHGAELNQRQVSRLIAEPPDGVEVQIAELLDEMVSNRVDRPQLQQRMQELANVVSTISRDQLPAIERGLISALKLAQSGAMNDGESTDAIHLADPALTTSLRETGTRQDEVIATLEQLLGELSQWDNYRRFAREVTRLRTAQQQLQQDTDQIRLETLGTDVQDLEPHQRAELKQLSERQLELARRFDKMHSRMAMIEQELRDEDPVAAETLADAQDVARRLAISAQMREGGRQIERNRVGQASEIQTRVGQHLQDLLDTLTNRREHELERRLRKLEEAATELKQLQEKQKQLREKAEQVEGNTNAQERRRELERLAREQKQLAERTERLARQLQRLRAEQSAETAGQAASQQQQSAQGSQEDKAQKALEHARQAEKLLDQAQRQLEAERREARRELLHEQMTRLEQEVAGLIGRQERLHGTTQELDSLRQEQAGQFREGQLSTVHDLADSQRILRADTAGLSAKIGRSKPFSLALAGILREMDRATRGLDQVDVGQATQTAQMGALARLRQMHEAVKQENKSPEEGAPSGNPPDQPKPSPPPADGIKRLAELKLLKMLQQEIQRRTGELESIRAQTGTLTDEMQREVEQLALEQGQLADLVFDLTQSIENNPVKVPDAPGDGVEESDPQDAGDESLDEELLEDLSTES